MSTDAESVAYATQIVPSFCDTPKCIVKKPYKMSSDAESLAYTTQIAGLLASRPYLGAPPKCIAKTNTN